MKGYRVSQYNNVESGNDYQWWSTRKLTICSLTRARFYRAAQADNNAEQLSVSSRNGQDTSHELYMWHGSLAGNLIVVSQIWKLWLTKNIDKNPLMLNLVSSYILIISFCLTQTGYQPKWHTSTAYHWLSVDNIAYHFNFLKTLDTIGKCQRPVFSLGISQHMHK